MTETIDADGVEVGAPLPVVSAPQHGTAMIARDQIDVSELLQQSEIIHQAMSRAMQDGIHYGRIPGVDKPTLLKPGAEKLLVLFRLAPSYESEKIWHDDGHLTVMTKCVLTHIPTGLVIAEGEGLCTTKESRYAWRKGERACPECGEPQVREGKPRDGRPGNWYCWKKQGGCGATWPLDSEQGVTFRAMDTGRVPNPDLPDAFNTVLKMSDKRSLLGAILNGTAASDVFTQDMEDRTTRNELPMPPVPDPTKPFDPKSMLLADAPKDWKPLMGLLQEIDAAIPWGDIIQQAITGVYGDEATDLKTADETLKREAFVRTANAATRISELFVNETFVSEETIRKAFAEMFEGVVVDLASVEHVEGEVVDPSSSDDAPLGKTPLSFNSEIPFGDDK